MNNRHSDPLIDVDDALRREIEDAFDVEPSPAFVTRVLASKPARKTWRFGWTFAVAASAAAAAIVAAVLVMPGRDARTPAPAAQLAIATLPPTNGLTPAATASSEKPPVAAAAPATPVTPVVPAEPPARIVAVARRAQPVEPEVLFAKDESAALQRLMRGITHGTVDPATLTEPTTTTAAIQPGEIVLAPLMDISPVVIEPFGLLAEGVRQ